MPYAAIVDTPADGKALTVDFFDYDPRMASYEAERRRKAAGVPDSTTNRRRSAAQITRDALFSEDAWQISHMRTWSRH